MKRLSAGSIAPVAAASALTLLLAGGAAQAQDTGSAAPAGPMGDTTASERPADSAAAEDTTTLEEPMDSAAVGPSASEGPEPAEPPQSAEAPATAEESAEQTASADAAVSGMQEDPMQSGLPDEQQAQLMMGQAVLDRQGEQVGEVTQIVRDPNTQQLSAVILPAGESFADTDARQQEVVASLDQLQQSAEGLQTDQDLASLPPYEEDQFEVVSSLEEPEGLEAPAREATQSAGAEQEEEPEQSALASPPNGYVPQESPAG